MKHKKILAGSLLTATLMAGGLYGVNAFAATQTNSGDSLASKIATKFNLNQDEVKKVIDEEHSARQAERQQEMKQRTETRLTQAVKDGKITEEQKTKILEYLDSQSTFMESLRDMTEDERKTAIENHKSEVKKWAQDNGIDEKYVMMGPGGHGGSGGRHGMDGNKDDSANQSTN